MDRKIGLFSSRAFLNAAQRQDEVYLDTLGAQRIPDPTMAGDFCRRFKADDVDELMKAINECCLNVRADSW